MGWRNKFDPTRLGVDRLRERARRLADIRYLGQQVGQIRRTGLRSEVLVPIAALVILTVALALSALSSQTLEFAEATATPTSSGESSELIGSTPVMSATTTISSSYPSPSLSPIPDIFATEPSGAPGLDETSSPYLDETIIAGDPSGGYPYGDSGPQGVDPAPGGGVPNVPGSLPTAAGFPTPGDSTYPTPGPVAPFPTPVPPPQLIPTTRPQPPVTDDNDTSYPAPEPTTRLPGNPTQAVPSASAETITPEQPLPGETSVAASVTPETSPTAEATTPAATPTPAPTLPPPTPTAPPSRVISGNVRWTTANSPIVLSENHVLAQGSTLAIDPGVQVQLGPNVKLTVAGKLQAQGASMVGTGGRWDGLVGTEGSSIVLDNVQISQAGRSGTAISSIGGTLVMRNSTIKDSGGGIVALGTALDLRNTYISGNSINGPVVNVQMPTKAPTAIIGNVIGGNGTPAGAPQIALNAGGAAGPLMIEGNLIYGSPNNGPGAVITTQTPLTGSIRCNGFSGGSVGLQLAARLPDATGFNLPIENNAFSDQKTYGATSTINFNINNNWWNDPSGPVDTTRNPQGRGVPVGVTLQFQPWLTARPACAPSQ